MAFDVTQFPLYYMDTFDLKTKRAGFQLKALALDSPGLKVIGFHPNVVFCNLSEMADYEAMRPIYHDPDKLLKHRRPGRGARTLLLELLDSLAQRNVGALTLSAMDAQFRQRENEGS
jgi:hypothetical protein